MMQDFSTPSINISRNKKFNTPIIDGKNGNFIEITDRTVNEDLVNAFNIKLIYIYRNI